MKKITHKKSGTIFLFISLTILWFIIGINNITDANIMTILIISVVLGAISAFIIGLLFIIMKTFFDW